MQTGTFRIQENSFIAGDRKLVIKKRKKPSKKPDNYLIQVAPFQYISSLFPLGNTTFEAYSFDFENKMYALKKLGDKVEIQEL